MTENIADKPQNNTPKDDNNSPNPENISDNQDKSEDISEKPTKKPKTFTQDEVASLLEEEKKKAKEETKRKAEKAKELAELEALEKSGEYKEKAVKLESKLSELESSLKSSAEIIEQAQTENKQLVNSLSSLLEKMKESLPEAIKPLIDKLSLPEQVEYLNENQETLMATQFNAPSPSPQANDKPDPKKMEQAKERSFYQTIRNF